MSQKFWPTDWVQVVGGGWHQWETAIVVGSYHDLHGHIGAPDNERNAKQYSLLFEDGDRRAWFDERDLTYADSTVEDHRRLDLYKKWRWEPARKFIAVRGVK